MKIHSIDLINKTHGRFAPGVDGQRFAKHIEISSLNKWTDIEILNVLKRSHPAFYLWSASKGANNLAIQRKKVAATVSEKLRTALQETGLSRTLANLAKIEYNLMKSDPKGYINEYNRLTDLFNVKLKYMLLDELKYSSLNRYKTQPILRVVIPKANGKMRYRYIPTMKDRSVQKFMQVVMEPYMEPTGDPNS
jgi:hypothetical protein